MSIAVFAYLFGGAYLFGLGSAMGLASLVVSAANGHQSSSCFFRLAMVVCFVVGTILMWQAFMALV